MYERSAIILERYFNELFAFDKKINLKTIYKDFKNSIEEVQKYQVILEEEDIIIKEFDNTANEIRTIQQEQNKLYNINIKAENERNQLFETLDEEPDKIEKKFKKLEDIILNNNERQKQLREQFAEALVVFNEKQIERNKYSKNKRAEEANYFQLIDKANKDIEEINVNILRTLKEFIDTADSNDLQEIENIMLENGKEERLPFNTGVIKRATEARSQIAKKEIQCYILVFDRMRKLLNDIDKGEVKLDKYNKVLRDVSTKLAFFNAQKMYIVSFLDNERMTSLNGEKVHKKLMDDACEKFDADIIQIENLYELILKETTGKATKKAYNELYNKEYLIKMEDKEKSFEKEVDNIQLQAGTIINSNYWRINEIKNIYQVFEEEITNKFGRDLSEFLPEEEKEEEEEEVIDNIYDIPTKNSIDDYNLDDFGIDEYEEDEIEEDDLEEEYEEDVEDEIFKADSDDDIIEYIEDYDYDDDEYEENDEEDEDFDYYEDKKESEEDDDETKKDNKRGKGLFNRFF